MVEKKIVEVKEEPEPKTPDELQKERDARVEEAPDSGEAAQETLDAAVQDSEGKLGGDSGTPPGGAGDRPEQDKDSGGAAGDKEGDLPAPSTR